MAIWAHQILFSINKNICRLLCAAHICILEVLTLRSCFKMFYLMYALNPQYTSFGSANAFLIRMPWELYRPLCLLYVFTRLFNGRFYASIQSPSTMTLLFITPSMGLCRVPGDNSVRLPYFSVRGIHNCTKRAWAHPSLSCIC